MSDPCKEFPHICLGKKPESAPAQTVDFYSDGSLITFAAAGTDKANALIVPNLKQAKGSVVVVDPDGGYYRATADARRSQGQRVYRVDPFRVLGEATDAIDPFNFMTLPEQDQGTAGQTLANLIFPSSDCANHADALGLELLIAVLGYCATVPEKRSLKAAVSVFYSDDVIYNLAVVLDTIGGKLPKSVYASISAFLQYSDQKRTEIIQAVHSRIALLADLSEDSLASISPSSTPLGGLLEGPPFSIYLVLPSNRLRSHAMLLRLWIGVMLHGLASLADQRSVLFLLDECQEIAPFPDFEAAMSLRWPARALLWSIWKSPAQLRARHPQAWTEMLENSGALQVIGPVSFTMDAEIEALFQTEPGTAASLVKGEQLVRLDRNLMRLQTLAN